MSMEQPIRPHSKKVTGEPMIQIDNIELPINTIEDSGCYIPILHACKKQLDSLLTYHCKVFTYRFDLHLKNATDDNRIVSEFIRKLRKKLTRKFGPKRITFKRVGFIWAREQHDAQTQHYHFALLLDGSKIRHPKNLHTMLTVIAQQLKMTVAGCPRPYANLNRENLDKYKDFFYRVSYLAKERGKEKGKRKESANDYSASRIKPNRANAWQGCLEDFAP
ncbi:inovirus Gp2 family protein [Vibrio sp. 2-Bac 85]